MYRQQEDLCQEGMINPEGSWCSTKPKHDKDNFRKGGKDRNWWVHARLNRQLFRREGARRDGQDYKQNKTLSLESQEKGVAVKDLRPDRDDEFINVGYDWRFRQDLFQVQP